MAIRIGLPPPVGARRRRGGLERYDGAPRAPLLQRLMGAAATRARSREAAASARLLETLRSFEERYEDLVDVLCWAAREGWTERAEARYGDIRAAIQPEYRILRRVLRAHWRAEDARDPFLTLFGPRTLTGVTDGAFGVEDMVRSRAALAGLREAFGEAP